MTAAQTKLYFKKWQLVRTILRAQGMKPKEADAQRYAIHKYLGVPQSSRDLTEDDCHKVLAHFRAIAASEETRL